MEDKGRENIPDRGSRCTKSRRALAFHVPGRTPDGWTTVGKGYSRRGSKPDQTSRPKHIDSRASSGRTAFNTWSLWKEPRKKTQKISKRTGHKPLTTGSSADLGATRNSILNPFWIWFSKDSLCGKSCWDMSFGFQLFSREKKMYLKGVPWAMNLFQHPLAFVFFPVYLKEQ